MAQPQVFEIEHVLMMLEATNKTIVTRKRKCLQMIIKTAKGRYL